MASLNGSKRTSFKKVLKREQQKTSLKDLFKRALKT
jgi:hypothetical protein